MAIAMNTSKSTGSTFKGETIGHCSGMSMEVINDGAENPQLSIKYTDPTEEGVPYGGTIVAIKEDSAPKSPEDADIVENTMYKDTYKTNPLVVDVARDNNKLSRNMFATLFPYGANGVRNMLKRETKNVMMNFAEKLLQIQKISDDKDSYGIEKFYLKQCITKTENANEYYGVFTQNDTLYITKIVYSETGITTTNISAVSLLTTSVSSLGDGWTGYTKDRSSYISPQSIILIDGTLYGVVTFQRTAPNTNGSKYQNGTFLVVFDISNTSLKMHNIAIIDNNDLGSAVLFTLPGSDLLHLIEFGMTTKFIYKTFAISGNSATEKSPSTPAIDTTYFAYTNGISVFTHGEDTYLLFQRNSTAYNGQLYKLELTNSANGSIKLVGGDIGVTIDYSKCYPLFSNDIIVNKIYLDSTDKTQFKGEMYKLEMGETGVISYINKGFLIGKSKYSVANIVGTLHLDTTDGKVIFVEIKNSSNSDDPHELFKISV